MLDARVVRHDIVVVFASVVPRHSFTSHPWGSLRSIRHGRVLEDIEAIPNFVASATGTLAKSSNAIRSSDLSQRHGAAIPEKCENVLILGGQDGLGDRLKRKVDLLTGLGLQPTLVAPTIQGRGTVSLKELGISDTQCILAPKFHAVVSLIPAVFDKSIFEEVTPTLSVPTVTDPFQCMILQGANQVAAVQVVLFIAALKKATGPWMPPPQLLELGSAIPATFVNRPSTRLIACIVANRLNMGSAHTARVSKPTLWDLRAQVHHGGGFDIED